MKIFITDIDLNWNSSEDGYVPISRQEQIIDHLLSYEFNLDLPHHVDDDDIKEELKWEITKMTDLDVYFLDFYIER